MANRQIQAFERINNLSGKDRNALFAAIRNNDKTAINTILPPSNPNRPLSPTGAAAQVRLFFSELKKSSGLYVPGVIAKPPPTPKTPKVGPPTPIQAPPVKIIGGHSSFTGLPNSVVNRTQLFTGLDKNNAPQANIAYITVQTGQTGQLQNIHFSITFERDESDKAKAKQMVAELLAELTAQFPNIRVEGHFQSNLDSSNGPKARNSGNQKTTLPGLFASLGSAISADIDDYFDEENSIECDIYFTVY